MGRLSMLAGWIARPRTGANGLPGRVLSPVMDGMEGHIPVCRWDRRLEVGKHWCVSIQVNESANRVDGVSHGSFEVC